MGRIDTDRHRSTRPWNRPSNHQNRMFPFSKFFYFCRWFITIFLLLYRSIFTNQAERVDWATKGDPSPSSTTRSKSYWKDSKLIWKKRKFQFLKVIFSFFCHTIELNHNLSPYENETSMPSHFQWFCRKFLQTIEFGFWWELFPRESKEMETIPIKKPLNCLFCSLSETKGNNNHVIETIKPGDENYIEKHCKFK